MDPGTITNVEKTSFIQRLNVIHIYSLKYKKIRRKLQTQFILMSFTGHENLFYCLLYFHKVASYTGNCPCITNLLRSDPPESTIMCLWVFWDWRWCSKQLYAICLLECSEQGRRTLFHLKSHQRSGYCQRTGYTFAVSGAGSWIRFAMA